MTSLGAHPLIGSVISIGHFVAGYVIGFALEIPPAVMQLVQLCVWVGGISVSAITVLGWLKKNTTLIDHWKFLK